MRHQGFASIKSAARLVVFDKRHVHGAKYSYAENSNRIRICKLFARVKKVFDTYIVVARFVYVNITREFKGR